MHACVKQVVMCSNHLSVASNLFCAYTYACLHIVIVVVQLTRHWFIIAQLKLRSDAGDHLGGSLYQHCDLEPQVGRLSNLALGLARNSRRRSLQHMVATVGQRPAAANGSQQTLLLAASDLSIGISGLQAPSVAAQLAGIHVISKHVRRRS